MERANLTSRFRFGFGIVPAALALLVGLSLVPSAAATPYSAPEEEENLGSVPAQQALRLLLEGNDRFVNGRIRARDYRREREALVSGQHPYAIILSCADSRVPPEIIFDETLGRLFVIRVAGEVVDPVALGSIEYAVEHLGVKLLVVLGHDSCGAVTAAVAGGETTPNVQALVDGILPAVVATQAASPKPPNLVAAAIEKNVELQQERCVNWSQLLENYTQAGGLEIVGGVYRLASGRVDFLGLTERPKAEKAPAEHEK